VDKSWRASEVITHGHLTESNFVVADDSGSERGPAFRDILKGWESLLLVEEIFTFAWGSIHPNMVGRWGSNLRYISQVLLILLPLLPFYPSKYNSESGFCGLDVAIFRSQRDHLLVMSR
jgi:hypothetical protein